MKKRKIYFVMAGGGQDTDRHYYETIKNHRSIEELNRFLDAEQAQKLSDVSHGRAVAVWGAVPGQNNIRNWEAMEDGDYVMVYRKGKIILAAEIAMKVRSADLGKFLWQENEDGKTWEYAYFMINDVEVNVGIETLNKYLGYESSYHPQGFMAIQQPKVDALLSTYGDLVSLLQKLERGEDLEEAPHSLELREELSDVFEEKIKRAPTEHDEMQWRLIRLGELSQLDVWIPRNDQGKQWNGNTFREHVLKEFQQSIDVPQYIKNIDTVWKLGHSIKAAFEIENSTAIYSGILRLSDLRALAPNSNYPLFIVADRQKRKRVFEQLRRPTFSNSYLQLDKAVSYLSYDVIRELDESRKTEDITYNIDWLINSAQKIESIS